MLHDISFPVWRRLLGLGFNLLSLKPWEWMREDMIFGVVQPENGEIGYCVVLGHSHPFQGLAVFKGPVGLYNYLRSWEDKQEVDLRGCIVLSFEKLDQFWKEEKELFEWLEVEPQEYYPMVREQDEGMDPWPLEDEEVARLMMFSLEQSISMAIRFKQERMLSAPFDPISKRMMVRAPFRKGAMLLWKDQWRDVTDDYEEGSHARATQLFMVSNCASLPMDTSTSWIIELFRFPDKLQPPTQRPYFPFGLIVADAKEEDFVGEYLFHPAELYDFLQIRIKDLLVFEGYKPARVFIVGEENFRIISKIFTWLGIKVNLVEKTPAYLEKMKEQLIES